MDNEILNIEDRQLDFNNINKEGSRAEHGIRAICVMYDDHSTDKNSKENIFILKDNVHYRIFSLVHQYLVFLRELGYAENYLKKVYENDASLFHSYPMGNPHFEKVELEVSSVFDSIIFQLSSVFDYISHLVCYICKRDKSKTLYWTKLAMSSGGKNNDFSESVVGKTIVELNSEFVGRLYDYRSRLIHNKKDQHIFNTSLSLNEFNFDLKIIASETSLNHFKSIKKEFPNKMITLSFLSSWLIKKSFVCIERILDSLKDEIIKSSNFHANLARPKKDGFMIVSVDPKTKYIRPASEGLWEQYKNWEKTKLSH